MEALGSSAFPGRASFAEAYPPAARLVCLLRPGFRLLGDLSSWMMMMIFHGFGNSCAMLAMTVFDIAQVGKWATNGCFRLHNIK